MVSVTSERPLESVPNGLLRGVIQILHRGGFQTQRDVYVKGTTLDIVAEYPLDSLLGTPRKYGINCKTHKRALSIDVVRDQIDSWFQAEAIEFGGLTGIYEYWLISKTNITSDAAAFLKTRTGHPKYRVWTLDEFADVIQRRVTPPLSLSADVGRSVHVNHKQLILSLASLELLIEEKLNSLNNSRPNSEEARESINDEITTYELLKNNLLELRNIVTKFINRQTTKSELVKSSNSFTQGVRNWWNNKHEHICEAASSAGIFTAAVTVCSLVGSGGPFTTVICGALVGGRPVIEALRAVEQKGASKLNRQSNQRTHKS
jgi:hypothetical protein